MSAHGHRVRWGAGARGDGGTLGDALVLSVRADGLVDSVGVRDLLGGNHGVFAAADKHARAGQIYAARGEAAAGMGGW